MFFLCRCIYTYFIFANVFLLLLSFKARVGGIESQFIVQTIVTVTQGHGSPIFGKMKPNESFTNLRWFAISIDFHLSSAHTI